MGPPTLPPSGKKKSGRREPAKVSRQAAPAPRSPAPYQGEPGCLGAGHHVPSPRDRRAKAEGAGCWLRRPLPHARPPGSRLWDRRARLAVDGRATARARRRGAAQQPTDERLTADAGYLSVRPRVGRPTGSACWLGAGARGTRPSPSPPGSGTGFCLEGAHFPTLPLPLLAERAAGGLRGPELPASHPAPSFSSRPLSPATFRALFSGWK